MTEMSFGGDIEGFLKNAEQNMAKAGQLKDRIAEVKGVGEAADGKIRAEFNSSDGLARLDLDPRALRLPSEELSEEIRSAVNAASKDFQFQLSQVTKSMFGLPEDPMGLIQDPASDMAKVETHARAQAAKLGDAFAGQMKDLLRELGVQQQRAKEAMEGYRGPGQP
ncbi:MAG: YbaB/EbfC family nucleoid-associated protein [Actinomadura sp.]